MTTPPDSGVSPDDLQKLAALLQKHDLTELRYEQGDTRVTLRTAAYFRQQTPVAVAPGIVASSGFAAPAEAGVSPDDVSEEVGGEEAQDEATDGVAIEAPIMGVFYRSASPSDPPFVEVGDSVAVGQAVGLIEAMKVFSEVKAETAGIVRAIPVANKSLVQPGDTLMVLGGE